VQRLVHRGQRELRLEEVRHRDEAADRGRTARTTRTPVIDHGDSWTWCSTSALIRERPRNVSQSRRNM
jgi:hypothetical protein